MRKFFPESNLALPARRPALHPTKKGNRYIRKRLVLAADGKVCAGINLYR